MLVLLAAVTLIQQTQLKGGGVYLAHGSGDTNHDGGEGSVPETAQPWLWKLGP